MPYFVRHRSVQLSLLVPLLALCLPSPSLAKDPATVVRAVDGDTLESPSAVVLLFSYAVLPVVFRQSQRINLLIQLCQ